MKDWINENPMTALLYVLAIIVAIPGAVLVVIGNLDYDTYQGNIVKFALAVGILGAGKAITHGLNGAPPQGDDGLPPTDAPTPAKERRKPTTTTTRAKSR